MFGCFCERREKAQSVLRRMVCMCADPSRTHMHTHITQARLPICGSASTCPRLWASLALPELCFADLISSCGPAHCVRWTVTLARVHKSCCCQLWMSHITCIGCKVTPCTFWKHRATRQQSANQLLHTTYTPLSFSFPIRRCCSTFCRTAPVSLPQYLSPQHHLPFHTCPRSALQTLKSPRLCLRCSAPNLQSVRNVGMLHTCPTELCHTFTATICIPAAHYTRCTVHIYYSHTAALAEPGQPCALCKPALATPALARSRHAHLIFGNACQAAKY